MFIANFKAQGEKRGESKRLTYVSYSSFSTHIKCAVQILYMFYSCSVGLFLKIGNRILNDNIYFLQFRLILNGNISVFDTCVFENNKIKGI